MIRPMEGRNGATAESLHRDLVDAGYDLPRPGRNDPARFAHAAYREMANKGVAGLSRPTDSEKGVLRFFQTAFTADLEVDDEEGE